MLARGSAPPCGRSRTLGWPDEPPIRRPLHPTSLLTTAAGIDLPLGRADGDDGDQFAATSRPRRLFVHPSSPGAGRPPMSKSLGTGIDPLDEIRPRRRRAALRAARHVIDPDVRYSPDRIQQGRDLANRCGTRRGSSSSTHRPRRSKLLRGWAEGWRPGR